SGRDARARRDRRRGAEALRARARGDGGLPPLGGGPRPRRRQPSRAPARAGTSMSAPALVSTEWLAKHLGEPDLRVVDGTWHMPQLGRDARAEYAQAHIPGAVFFDIDRIADRTTALPHMLPTAETFAAAVVALGIGSGDRV